MPQPLPELPKFSSKRLHAKLEALRQAYEAKGFNVTDTLQPALSAQELQAQCSWFPAPLPEEIISLYAWRGGQIESGSDDDFAFAFEGRTFLTLEDAKLEYDSMMSTYGAEPSDAPLLRTCFPFAAYNGGWLVMPCADQSLEPRLERPIISVMQGISIHYYSLELMVVTALDEVLHPQYDGYNGLPEAISMEIWDRHNPGISAY
jgi:hypothetical protein